MLKSLLLFSVLTLAVPTLTSADECAGAFDNRWWPVKGGIAIIRDGIYVGAGATKTNLVIIQDENQKGEQRWTGRSADVPEVVVVFERRVLDWSALPKNFDLSRAIIISFEPARVRVFDFVKARGGYYQRLK